MSAQMEDRLCIKFAVNIQRTMFSAMMRDNPFMSKFDGAGLKALIICLVSSIRRAQMLGVQGITVNICCVLYLLLFKTYRLFVPKMAQQHYCIVWCNQLISLMAGLHSKCQQ